MILIFGDFTWGLIKTVRVGWVFVGFRSQTVWLLGKPGKEFVVCYLSSAHNGGFRFVLRVGTQVKTEVQKMSVSFIFPQFLGNQTAQKIVWFLHAKRAAYWLRFS